MPRLRLQSTRSDRPHDGRARRLTRPGGLLDDDLLAVRTAVGGGRPSPPPALSRRTLSKAATAGLAVTASPYFGLAKPSYDFFPDRDQPLHESGYVMQSFAFDNVNRRLFVAQLRDSSADALCITQLDLNGDRLGFRHLTDVGHGVSIAAEAVGTDTYLWTEALSDNDSSPQGTALQRFQYVNGQAPSNPRLFLTGSTDITCATDPVNRCLLVRRHDTAGRATLAVYGLSAAAAGDFSQPLSRIVQPDVGGVFQGYTLYGTYAYLLTGQGHADPADIDSMISCIDLNTGAVQQDNVLTRAGRTGGGLIAGGWVWCRRRARTVRGAGGASGPVTDGSAAWGAPRRGGCHSGVRANTYRSGPRVLS